MRFHCGNDWEMESVAAFHHLLESHTRIECSRVR